jgi:4'-phosphopantetheinyl transferase
MPAERNHRVVVLEGLAEGGAAAVEPLPADEVILAIARPPQSEGGERIAALAALLSDDERSKAARFRFESDRLLYLVAHALLRVTLSRYSDVPPEAWRFRSGKHGRPEISSPSSRLRFSLSHTPGLAACAVIVDRDIGLDVEDRSRRVPMEIAQRFFSTRETCDLLGAPVDTRSRKFLQYWTLKEAYVKARGLGLSLPLKQFSVYNDACGEWRISFDPLLNDDPSRWWLWSSGVGNNHEAALAIG